MTHNAAGAAACEMMDTLAVHAGFAPDPATGSIMAAIYQRPTFAQNDVAQHKGYEYGRSGNPTRSAPHVALVALEGGRAALEASDG